ncbi:MAG: hypothetical protein AAFP93_01380 [Bacteroidota bacterium]
MKVFKFGGGVIQDAAAIVQLRQVIQQEAPAVVVVSAMGKTTRMLEDVLQRRIDGISYETALQALYSLYQGIIDQLLSERRHVASQAFREQQVTLEQALTHPYTSVTHDRLYSKVVAWGELVTSMIIFHYLVEQEQPCRWMDARTCIKTQGRLCHAAVDWPATKEAIRRTLAPIITEGATTVLTQGFIGSQGEHTATLGKEGSDYTAAVLAAALGATSVTFWKDVPGIMNADPKQYAQARQFKLLAYQDMATMAFCGAKVIHPGTLQPLSEHNISLHIRSFYHPQKLGTMVTHQAPPITEPIYIIRDDQCLLQISVAGQYFFEEAHIQEVLQVLAQCNLSIQLLCRNACSLSVCITKDPFQEKRALEGLSRKYVVKRHTSARLFTALYPKREELPSWVGKATVLLTQRHQHIFQAVLEGADA